MIRRISFAALLLAVLASGCESPPPDAFVNTAGQAGGAAAVPVGRQRSWRALPLSGRVRAAEAVIYCGDWEQPSGRVAELNSAAGPAQLGAIAASGVWRTTIDQRFACGAPVQTSILAGSPAVLMECTRRVGGWPHLALASVVEGRVFVSDAVRPALPALERTIAALAGRSLPADAAPAASEARRLIAQRSGGAPFGSGDLARFFEQLRLGDAYNNIGDPVNAERAYREALAIQQRILGPNDPGLALTMMKLGAQFAHQGNRREAERLLANAAALTARQPDPLLVAQLDFYRATAAAYNGNPDEATPLRAARRNRIRPAGAGSPGQGRPRTRNRRRGRAGWHGDQPGRGERGWPAPMWLANSEERAATLGLAETMRLHATLLQFSGQMEDAQALARRAEQLLAGTGLSYSSTGGALAAADREQPGSRPRLSGGGRHERRSRAHLRADHAP